MAMIFCPLEKIVRYGSMRTFTALHRDEMSFHPRLKTLPQFLRLLLNVSH
jgi:hypothetical protein